VNNVEDATHSTSSDNEHDVIVWTEGDIRNLWNSLRSVYGDKMCNLDEYIECDNVHDTTHQLTDEQIVDQIQNPAADPDDWGRDENTEVEEAEQPKTYPWKNIREILKLFELSSVSTELDELHHKPSWILLKKWPVVSYRNP